MKPLDSIEIMLCRSQAKLFEASVKKTQYSSPIFIRRFLNSTIADSFDNKSFLFQTMSSDEVFETIDLEFGKSTYGKTKYSEDQMFWIGYIYRCICLKYNISSKTVYKLFNAEDIVKYYNIGHTYDVVDMAERMIENIKYDNSTNQEKALKAMRRIIYNEKIIELLGKNVEVIIDRKLGSYHPEYNDLKYELNYGYIKDLISPDGEYQDAYVIGIEKPIDSFNGKVIAVVKRKNDIEDKLVVCEKDKDFSIEEIEKHINFQEKFFKHKIIKKELN